MHSDIEKTKKRQMFQPNKGFFELQIVWVTIAVITFMSIGIIVVIILNSNLKIDLSYDGWNSFIKYFQVPLGILALLIPIGAVYATNHRSRQALEQMRLTTEQNNFSNYYKHLEEFEKYCAIKIPSSKIPTRRLHQILYTKSRKGNYDADTSTINALLVQFFCCIKALDNEGMDKWTFGELLERSTISIIYSVKSPELKKLITIYEDSCEVLKKQRNESTDCIKSKNAIHFFLSFYLIASLLRELNIAAEFDTEYLPMGVISMLNDDIDITIKKLGLTEDNITNYLPYLWFSDEQCKDNLMRIEKTSLKIGPFISKQESILEGFRSFASGL